VVILQEDEDDASKYRPWETSENAGYEEDEEEEVEMKSMKLLVSANSNNSAEL